MAETGKSGVRIGRRNVRTAAAANGIGFAGFTLAMPFLPLYIRELGVTDVGDIALWTGLILGATPAVTAVSAPLWGRIGDRYGSKLLVLRSLTAFALTKGAMAFVAEPWQLLALRALLGVFAGYGALTVSMAAKSVPREQMTDAIGTVQVAQRLGPAIGPLIGGVLAPLVGLRATFVIAAAFYLVALALVALLYVEPPSHIAAGTRRRLREVLRELLRTPGFVMVFLVIFCLQTVDRSFGPILPLYVELLGGSPARVPLVSGVLFSIAAVFAALGHKMAGPLLARRSPRTLIGVSSVATALGLTLLVAVPSEGAFAVALAIAGVAIGVGMTAAYSSGGALLPPDAHATGFGLLTTASLLGMAISPIVAGFISGPELRIVFEVDILLLALLAGLVWARLKPGPIARQDTAASDAKIELPT